ncbi:lactocepin [Alteribacter lacisalsi]|uniref:Lactocepin n=1 Tax=Alteribacter lacisalsi TaxID=2045244 RepID=A0A2W0H251_9BACI|nr:cell wall-binding repeat-containing protein [Alteribacter lacisalsi]PYZ95863.1 lactocepin [Alteribacter lacisalsi]
MKGRKSKQIFSVMMAVLLLFSNFAFMGGQAQAEGGLGLQDKQEGPYDDNLGELDVTNAADEYFAEDDEVRVIVEVSEPAIQTAISSGVSFSDLPESEQIALHENALATQEAVKSEISSTSVDIEYFESFTTVVNGFSAAVKYGDIDRLHRLSGVESVEIVNEYERPEMQPEMVTSKEMIRAYSTWDNFGYDGEGMVIGIIDSGIDPWHQDMVLSEGNEFKIDEELVESLDIPGIWFSDKVPYGYNYIDHSNEVLEVPRGSSHGMHVAGTAGANGDEDNGGIKGVAPEAQLLGLKVFSNDPLIPTTYGDIYVAALDDAIKLGVDVLNLSLGSTAGFVNPDNHEQKAVMRAKESGVAVTISAGNSAHFGNGFSWPLASNPDIGVTGAPSVSEASTGVASSENTYLQMEAMNYVAGEDEGVIPFLLANDYEPSEVLDGDLEVVYAGYGGPSRDDNAYPVDDFADIDVEGKVALIERGQIPFVDKALNAQEAGAAAVIIFNNASGYIAMASSDAITIPQIGISRADGHLLRDALEAGEDVTVAFEGEEELAPNPDAGKLSNFTSWGLTPNLDFKPEITAPGGNILSTIQGGGYGLMSGTSMAAPHVAGGNALILERVDTEFGYEGYDRVQMAKNLLMNTAVPKEDLGLVNTAFGWELPYSPRRQGAGEMDLHAANETPAAVVDPETGEGKVALRQVNDEVSFDLELHNFSEDELTYDLSAVLQTDFVAYGELGWEPDTLEAMPVDNVDVYTHVNGDAADSLTVAGNGTATVTVEFDLSDAMHYDLATDSYVAVADSFENGYFIEGFVSFEDPTDTNPELSVPFVGFNGDWGAVPIFDEDGFYQPLYGVEINTLFGAGSKNFDGYHAFNPELGDVFPIITLLRNARTVEFNVLSEDEDKLRTIRTQNYVRKNFYDRGAGQPIHQFTAAAWDGTVSGNQVEDGAYYYELRGVADFPGAEYQSFKIPTLVDTVAPEVEASFDEDTHTIHWTATDSGSGVSSFIVTINGEPVSELPIPAVEGQEEYSLEIDGLPNRADIEVMAFDFAGNMDSDVVEGLGDRDSLAPIIYIDSPDLLAAYATHDIPVAGYIAGGAELTEFTVNGQDIDVTYNSTEQVYEFNSTVNVGEDDVHDIFFKAVDENDREFTLNRQIFVDTEAPHIHVDVPAITTADSVTMDLTLMDNFDELRLYVDDSEVFFHELVAPYEKRALEVDLEHTVSLNQGVNTFELRAVDIAGNETVEHVSVNKVDEAADAVNRLYGENRLETAVEISQAGWDAADTVVISNSNSYADSITGAPLAYHYDAPVLLTRTNALSAGVLSEIDRLGADHAIVLGGEAAVGAGVIAQLEAQGLSVDRIAGENRYETAEEIAYHLDQHRDIDNAVVVNRGNFPDALSVAPFAAAHGMPILLANEERVPESTLRMINRFNVDTTYVIGGETVLGDDVFNSLPSAHRLSGANRYDTNVEVLNYFGTDSDEVFVATGRNFADALAGSSLAAKHGAGIVLAGGSLTAATESYLSDLNFNQVTIFGGPHAVSEAVEAELVAIVQEKLHY